MTECKMIRHELLDLEGLKLGLKVFEWADGRRNNELECSIFAHRDGRTAYSSLTDPNMTPVAMDKLAEQLELAALQIRTVIAEQSPGRAFETQQAAQFAVDRLEDGEIAQ